MVIGNKGAKSKPSGLKRVKTCRKCLKRLFTFELWVKVKSGWADDERALRSLGYVRS